MEKKSYIEEYMIKEILKKMKLNEKSQSIDKLKGFVVANIIKDKR